MFRLPHLPYAYSALEPYIDAQTMELHYTKHHQAYTDGLNQLIKDFPELEGRSIEALLVEWSQLPHEVQQRMRNFGGGYDNHTRFWEWLTPHGQSLHNGYLHRDIVTRFGSFEQFQSQFGDAAKSVFGSGWAWLVFNREGLLQIVTTPNQDSPLMQGMMPLIGLDVWEHAYYLKYQNRRVEYITAWWHVINWDRVEATYQQYR